MNRKSRCHIYKNIWGYYYIANIVSDSNHYSKCIIHISDYAIAAILKLVNLKVQF